MGPALVRPARSWAPRLPPRWLLQARPWPSWDYLSCSSARRDACHCLPLIKAETHSMCAKCVQFLQEQTGCKPNS